MPNLRLVVLLATILSVTTGQQYQPQQQNYPQTQYDRQSQSQYNPQGQYSPSQGQYSPQGQYYPQGQYSNQGQTGQYGQGQSRFGQNQGQYGQTPGQYSPQNQQYPSSGTGQQYDPNNRRYDQQNNYGQESYGVRDENCCEEYCYKQDEQPYLYFGTKTAYTFVYGKRIKDHIIPQCRPIQFWSLNRHGTRFPGRNKIERMRALSRIHDELVRNYEERRSFPEKGRLCNEDFDLLKLWRWNDTITPDRANSLTRQGIDDLKFLARRSQTRFRDLLGLPYSDMHYYFKYADSDRTHDSYQAYIEGLFGNNAYQVHAAVQTGGSFQQPDGQFSGSNRNCDAVLERFQEGDMYTEYQKFKDGREYKEMIRNVFRRLGFRYNLNASIVEDIYDMCRYEKAWYINRHSPWCAAFTKEQLKILEYAEDLKYYYFSGYGNDISKKIGCSLAKDLFDRFDRTVNGNAFDDTDDNGDRNSARAIVHFTHSTPFQAFLTVMDIAKDPIPLRADNYYQQSQRNWRTSKTSPFAANLAAVLYQCDQGEQYKVMFFLNEQPVDLPGCAVGLCSWQNIRSNLQQVSENCDPDYCEKGGSVSLTSGYLYVFALVVSIYKFYF